MRFAPFPPVVLGFAGFALLGGCAIRPAPPPPSLSAAAGAESFTGRSLHDDGLRRFLGENLSSPPSLPWDFETLSWVSFYYHPSLELARAQWATARAVERTAGVRPNPTLTFTPGYNSTRVPGVSPWMPGINFDFLFPTNGKRERQMAIARDEAEVARLGVFT